MAGRAQAFNGGAPITRRYWRSGFYLQSLVQVLRYRVSVCSHGWHQFIVSTIGAIRFRQMSCFITSFTRCWTWAIKFYSQRQVKATGHFGDQIWVQNRKTNKSFLHEFLVGGSSVHHTKCTTIVWFAFSSEQRGTEGRMLEHDKHTAFSATFAENMRIYWTLQIRN